MEIKEMNNEQLLKNYAVLLQQIDNNHSIKKQFEEEFKRRLMLKEDKDV